MRDSLFIRHAYNDLRNNPGVTIALGVVLVLSAFLMATGAMVMERLVGSVDQLFEQAEPPHFLQMHKGAYDPAAVERFAAQEPTVEDWLIEEMVGFDGATISWQRAATGETGDLSESLIDNLFVAQNDGFDFLIDQNGTVPQPAPGEVYLPVVYQQQLGLVPGDTLRIHTDSGTEEFRVQGVVRDGQMASSLSPATRFLVSDADLRRLLGAGGGEPEVIVEFRLTDPALSSQLQQAYAADQSLPQNGQAVTYAMVRLFNALGDGMIAIALMLVSLVLITIALLNVRFVIRGTLEDEVREIGAMKAIGLPSSTITRLYLAKYGLITLAACLVGGLLAVIATGLLTRGIQTNYAVAPVGLRTVGVPLLALALVFLIVLGICYRVLRAVRRIDVVAALVHGSTLDVRRNARRLRRQARQVRRDRFAGTGRLNLNRRLIALDLRAESGQWLLIPVVFFLAAVLMILPLNLFSTFTDSRFVTYLGAPESSIRSDVMFSETVDQTSLELLSAMRADDRLTDVRAFALMLYETRAVDGGWTSLKVEVGDYTDSSMPYVDGARPAVGEIALSVLNAEKYGLSVGDQLTIRSGDEPQTLRVSGIYQDLTNGGETAKLQGTVTSGAIGYGLFADTVAGADPTVVAADYDERFPSATTLPTERYLDQTMSYLTDAFGGVAVVSLVFAVGVAALMTTLFLKLRLSKDRHKMGVLSAVGFATGEIIAQFRWKVLIAVGTGTVLGAVFAATGGERVVGAAIGLAGLGISQLEFIPNPWIAYLCCPVVLAGAGFLGSVALTSRLRRADKTAWLD